MRRLLPVLAVPVLGLALLGSLPGAAAQDASKTRVYLLSLDGLRPDEVALMPFLQSLADEGTYYTESRAVMVAETIPNHVSMVTGAYPDRTGIVANNFPVPGRAENLESGDPSLLQADSLFTVVADQCPELTTAAVTSKDYLFTVLEHDRNGDGARDADSNFDNPSDPSFIPGLGLTLDERTVPEAVRVSRELDPDFLFMNFGSIDRTGHVDPVGGVTAGLPTGAAPAARTTQLVRTDALLRTLVDELKSSGRWESTVLMITADHSMDFSTPAASVTLGDDIAADPQLAGKVQIAQNGGAALYSLINRSDPKAPALLKRLRAIAKATDGVDEALYRTPNSADGGSRHWVGRVHPDWHQTGPRSGDLLVTVKDGRRISEPTPVTSNPLPGNHGMTSTLRIPSIVSGGLDAVNRLTFDPVAPVSGAVRLAGQAENVDFAPTAAWLLGAQAPAAGFDGRVLTEAFSSRPAATCGAPSTAAVATGGDTAPAGGTDPAALGPAVVGPAGLDPTAADPAPARVQAGSARTLPSTGPATGLAVVALVATAGAALLRRRRAT